MRVRLALRCSRSAWWLPSCNASTWERRIDVSTLLDRTNPRKPWRALTSRKPAAERGSFPKYFLLILVSIFAAFPFSVMLVLALRSPGPVPSPDALLPAELSLDSIRSALGNDSILSWAVNTTIYALVSVVGVLFLAS